ncbi:DUF4097 family beta strand repeat-containing protein [Carboxylicivirga sp. N1Y90]|uniref:DUF4097 family beta strand repeat-containing protein n=1 Tax=Carboxylicivirga fragile TaxID=3417571 RepID=UPI003D33E38B|nr:DUF4097 family beta strand repeat protein [Marinilabiliaceae bacterium N1Y90]
MRQLILIGAFTVFSLFATAQEAKIDETFENITEIEVDVIFSNVNIEATDGNTVSVKGLIEWSNTKQDFEIITEVRGTTLHIEVDHPRNVKGNTSGNFDIKLPSLTDVKVNTISGNVKLNGVGQQSIKLNSISGNLNGDKLTGDVKATTISGNIYLSDIKGHVKTSSVSGNLKLSDVDGNLKGSSVSGDFRIENLKGNKEISTVSGSVRQN